jgi:hypothetical protein
LKSWAFAIESEFHSHAGDHSSSSSDRRGEVGLFAVVHQRRPPVVRLLRREPPCRLRRLRQPAGRPL